jgi:serine/threonine protein kinase/tetratricopeptide (TPR) repeat protein
MKDVEIFTIALQLPPAHRAAFLQQACAGDEELRRKIEALLVTNDSVGDFLEQLPSAVTVQGRLGTGSAQGPGDRIGRYQLLQQIGEGGCGVVYLAEQEEPIRRRVALKIVKPGMDSKSVIARFEAERQALALMDHPNIAKVLDAGATEYGRPYFVMELVPGVKISEYCDQNSLTTRERLNLFVQVCQAVQHAHQKGIIHRDIKPSNILVTRTTEGTPLPKVIDFGIAKATTGLRLTDKTLFTAFEMLIGTPAYMSPEQAALTSVDVDTRTDIYSLGVLLYELLTGTTPFDTRELLKAGLDEVRRVIRSQEPLRPSTRLCTMVSADLTTVARCRQVDPPKLIRALRGDLDWIVMKALEKDRTRRYQTAIGLAEDVQHSLANEAVSARPPSTLYKLKKVVLRNKLLFSSVSVIIVLLIAGLVGATWLFAREKRARSEAEAGKQAAQTEAARSQQVTRFLQDMLRGVAPSVALGRDTTLLREILDKTARRLETELTNQPLVQADLHHQLGNIYWELGQYEQSESMLRQALAIRTQTFGEDEAASDVMNDLGNVLGLEFKHSEAEGMVRRSLAVRQQLLGGEHIKVAESFALLGAVFWRQNRLPDAEAMLRKSLTIHRKLLGEEDPRLGDSLVGMGSVLFQQGKHREAEELFRQAANNFQKELGEDHPSVLGALQNLAVTLDAQGRYNEAETLFRRLVATRRKLYPDQHPLLAGSLFHLAHYLMRQGEYGEAESTYREALAVQRKFKADTDPEVVRTLNELVFVLNQQHKLQDAEQLLADVLPPNRRPSPEHVGLLRERGSLFARQGRWKEAEADAAVLLETAPDDHMNYHTLAPLLVQVRDFPAYQGLCKSILNRFSSTNNIYVADRMAKDCLIVPVAELDLTAVGKLADLAVTNGKESAGLPLFRSCKALAEYRQQHFADAAEWAQKAIESTFPYSRAGGYAVLAMAQYHLKESGNARDSLAKAAEVASSKLPAIEGGDLGEDWRDWIIVHAVMDEARNLIEGTPASQDQPGK